MTQVLFSEEDVKIKFLIPYLAEYGYSGDCISYNVSIVVQQGRKQKTIFADAVVYSSNSKISPILLCETKHPKEPLSRQARDQAISYARLLDKMPPLVLLTNGTQVHVYHSLSKERIRSLPSRSELEEDIVGFVVPSDQLDSLRLEAKHELFIIDDVRTFKSILRACHNEIRNSEGLDPTAAFDELSKIMFCKLYEEKENPSRNRFRDIVYRDTLERLNVNVVHKILKEAKKKPGYSEIFSSDASVSLRDRTVGKLVKLLEQYDLGLTSFDVKGEAFEYFLGETFTGGLGEYFTPRNVVEFMVDAVDPKIGEKIIDPFCGTGGFLIYAFEKVSDKIRLNEFADDEKTKWKYRLSNESLYGTDWKERTSQACKMNMMVHGDGSSGIFMHNGFIDVPGAIEDKGFDLCLTNPPFGATEADESILKEFDLGEGRPSIDRVFLAVERSIRLVKPGGRIAIVVIDGLLNNKSAKFVRDYIKQNTKVQAIISMNKETFQGYGSEIKTSILILQRKDEPDKGEQEDTFMAVAANTGYAPNGDVIAGNELPDILMNFQAFAKGDTEFIQRNFSWACKLDERMDVEYYMDYVETPRVSIDSLREEILQRVDKVQNVIGSDVALLTQILQSVSFKIIQIDEVLESKTEKVKVADEKMYRCVGVSGRGKGAFIREKKLGKNIKAKYLYKLRPGWVVYNRLFASRGAFAIVPDEFDGAVVSNEFKTFECKDGIEGAELIKSYIVHSMNSPKYRAIMDAMSTGSAQESRKRLPDEFFPNAKINIPVNHGDLKRIVELLDRLNELRGEQADLQDMSQTLLDECLGKLPS